MKMIEETDLLMLAKLSIGTPNEEDAFVIRDPNTKDVLFRIHNLQELVQILSDVEPEVIFPSFCRDQREEFECDIALWVHYVLGDVQLSVKIFLVAQEFKDNSEKMKLEIFNLCFNRYLNFKEIMEYSDGVILLPEDKIPPPDI